MDSAPDVGALLPVDRSGTRDLVGYVSRYGPEGEVFCELEIEPRHLNLAGVLHGGFIAMLLDNACGFAVRVAIGDLEAPAVTVSLAVNFIAAAKGGRVRATGRVTGGGKSLKFVEGALHDAEGRLLATASGSFKLLRKPG